MTQNINVKAKMSRTDKEAFLLRGWLSFDLTLFPPLKATSVYLQLREAIILLGRTGWVQEEIKW